MKWRRHKILSETDMDLLAGSELMGILQRNRIFIKYDPQDKKPSYEELGLFDVTGLVYPVFKQNDQRQDTLEILFENVADMDIVEQHLTQFKMGQD